MTLRSLYVLMRHMVEWGELSFKVVRLEQQGQEVLARAGNFLVAQAAFDTRQRSLMNRFGIKQALRLRYRPQ